jgi:hypothetical protein
LKWLAAAVINLSVFCCICVVCRAVLGAIKPSSNIGAASWSSQTDTDGLTAFDTALLLVAFSMAVNTDPAERMQQLWNLAANQQTTGILSFML